MSSEVSGEKLLEAFFWLEPTRNTNKEPFQAPKVLWHFPDDVSHIIKNFKDIPQFCYPDINSIQLEKASASRSDFFIFSLFNAETNERFYGISYRRLFRGRARRYDSERRPKHCVCLISKRPYFQFFKSLLIEIFSEGLIEEGSGVCKAYASRLLAPLLSVPSTGPSLFSYQTMKRSLLGEKCLSPLLTWTVPSTPEKSLQTLPMIPLLSLFGAEKFLRLFTAMLTEKRLLFISEDSALLTSMMLSTLPMILPFSWPHPFITLLPVKMLSLLTVPGPFLYGVKRESLEGLAREELKGMIIVDLDRSYLGDITGNVHIYGSSTSNTSSNTSSSSSSSAIVGLSAVSSSVSSSVSLSAASSSPPPFLMVDIIGDAHTTMRQVNDSMDRFTKGLSSLLGTSTAASSSSASTGYVNSSSSGGSAGGGGSSLEEQQQGDIMVMLVQDLRALLASKPSSTSSSSTSLSSLFSSSTSSSISSSAADPNAILGTGSSEEQAVVWQLQSEQTLRDLLAYFMLYLFGDLDDFFLYSLREGREGRSASNVSTMSSHSNSSSQTGSQPSSGSHSHSRHLQALYQLPVGGYPSQDIRSKIDLIAYLQRRQALGASKLLVQDLLAYELIKGGGGLGGTIGSGGGGQVSGNTMFLTYCTERYSQGQLGQGGLGQLAVAKASVDSLLVNCQVELKNRQAAITPTIAKQTVLAQSSSSINNNNNNNNNRYSNNNNNSYYSNTVFHVATWQYTQPTLNPSTSINNNNYDYYYNAQHEEHSLPAGGAYLHTPTLYSNNNNNSNTGLLALVERILADSRSLDTAAPTTGVSSINNNNNFRKIFLTICFRLDCAITVSTSSTSSTTAAIGAVGSSNSSSESALTSYLAGISTSTAAYPSRLSLLSTSSSSTLTTLSSAAKTLHLLKLLLAYGPAYTLLTCLDHLLPTLRAYLNTAVPSTLTAASASQSASSLQLLYSIEQVKALAYQVLALLMDQRRLMVIQRCCCYLTRYSCYPYYVHLQGQLAQVQQAMQAQVQTQSAAAGAGAGTAALSKQSPLAGTATSSAGGSTTPRTSREYTAANTAAMSLLPVKKNLMTTGQRWLFPSFASLHQEVLAPVYVATGGQLAVRSIAANVLKLTLPEKVMNIEEDEDEGGGGGGGDSSPKSATSAATAAGGGGAGGAQQQLRGQQQQLPSKPSRAAGQHSPLPVRPTASSASSTAAATGGSGGPVNPPPKLPKRLSMAAQALASTAASTAASAASIDLLDLSLEGEENARYRVVNLDTGEVQHIAQFTPSLTPRLPYTVRLPPPNPSPPVIGGASASSMTGGGNGGVMKLKPPPNDRTVIQNKRPSMMAANTANSATAAPIATAKSLSKTGLEDLLYASPPPPAAAGTARPASSGQSIQISSKPSTTVAPPPRPNFATTASTTTATNNKKDPFGDLLDLSTKK